MFSLQVSGFPVNRQFFIWALLVSSVLIGVLTSSWSTFTDEADNLVIGALLNQDYVLYRDIFSHHFPFPYYWSALIVAIFGKSIMAVRISVLFFQMATFVTAGILSRYLISMILASLVWNVIRLFYIGQMLVYSALSAPALLAIFAITLAIISGKIKPSWHHALAIGIFSNIAFLSDPLSAYAIAVTLGCLVVLKPRIGMIAGITGLAGLLLFGVHLFLTSSYTDFVQDTIAFNAQIYSKYAYASPVRFREILRFSINGLGMFNPIWLDYLPFKELSEFAYSDFDRWIFTGLFYRLAILLLAGQFLVHGRKAAALYTILFAAALLSINIYAFRASGFVMVSLFAASCFVTQQWDLPSNQSILRWLGVALKIGIACMAIWLMIRVAAYTWNNRVALSYQANFGWMEVEAERILQLDCDELDVSLAYYPGNPYIYWFTNIPPVSRYIVMFPWTAEVGESEVMEDLVKDPSIVYISDTAVWGHFHTKDYLQKLFQYLDAQYVKLDDGFYVSSDLANCSQ